MQSILKTNNGELIQGDNLEVLKTVEDNSVDSCISDFPYDLSFMGKKWDNTGNFYQWCKDRSDILFNKIKSGGYICIFGHPKTNHRMKCAFEDSGFNIVEEIDWVYGTGFPKNQDIGKLFDKKAGVEREIIKEIKKLQSFGYEGNNVFGGDKDRRGKMLITAPTTDSAKTWDGWKTSGLKPAHEPITVFQKPLEGTYIQNIEKYNCGAMNIDACRVEFSTNDDVRIGKDYSHNTKAGLEIGQHKDNANGQEQLLHNPMGRFPANMIFDSEMGDILDSQSGISKSSGGSGVKSHGGQGDNGIYGQYDKANAVIANLGGLGDTGGASRYFLNIDNDDSVPFMYCPKATKKEKGEGNVHVTVKPKELIKWLIKLVTPVNGTSIDITAGSGTHGMSCEELNKLNGYNLKWLNIEMMNTEKEPYCDIAKNRIESVTNQI